MKSVLLFLCVILCQEEIAFKPKEEFDLKLNFQFKERTQTDPNKVELDPESWGVKGRGVGPLPYLFLNLQVLKQGSEEYRIKVYEGGTKIAYNKKVDLNTIIKLDLGFTDDIKDRVSAHEYNVIFYKETKEPVSRIVIFFQEDGTYLVNGQVRGKL